MDYPFHIRDIQISDPYILADENTHKYYTYAALFNRERFPELYVKGRFYALVSEDLIHWSNPIQVFENTDFWADEDYWAPECHYYRGNYYLISSFRAAGKYRKCQCLISDSPLGPFRPIKQEALTPPSWQSLDGTLYEDLKGQPWLVFCHEWMQVGDGQIVAMPITEELASPAGEPQILFRASAAPWGDRFVHKDKGGGGFVTDGPFLYRMQDKSLLMLWSTFTSEGYAVGYAKSLSGEIQGPWEQRENPLYFHDGGHAMLFHTFEGKLIMALHCPNDHPKKRMLLFEMEDKDGELYIINEVTGNWYDRGGGCIKKYAYENPCTEDIHI